MSSGFVSGGTNEQPVERDDEWLEAQKEIEETRRRKAEESRQQDGKTLYETLQANKAAKQEAFEESIRLKNQFRTLDDDEVDFLDSVLESTRAQEAAIKKDTTEQLEVFRRQQEKADAALVGADPQEEMPRATDPTVTAESEQWSVGNRKRKKARHDHPNGLKIRKTSTGENHQDTIPSTSPSKVQPSDSQSSPSAAQKGTETASSPISTVAQSSSNSTHSSKVTKMSTDSSRKTEERIAKPAVILGLGDYSSDEDD